MHCLVIEHPSLVASVIINLVLTVLLAGVATSAVRFLGFGAQGVRAGMYHVNN